mgnify:CR=1 FL=1
MEINEHIIRIFGKATLTQPLDLSQSFKLEVDGAVTETSDTDNQDGTVDRTYKFKPTIISVLKSNGEVTRTKDTRSRSVQMRAVITREWREDVAGELTAEEYYDRRMMNLIGLIIDKKV